MRRACRALAKDPRHRTEQDLLAMVHDDDNEMLYLMVEEAIDAIEEKWCSGAEFDGL